MKSSRQRKIAIKMAKTMDITHASRLNTRIGHEPDINSTDANDLTILRHLIIEQSAVIIDPFIKRFNVDVNQKDMQGNPPLELALLYKHPKIIEILLMNGADVNAFFNKTRFKTNALIQACESGDRVGRDIFSILINHGANVNVKDTHGNTPLYYAARNLNLDACKQLLLLGSDTHVMRMGVSGEDVKVNIKSSEPEINQLIKAYRSSSQAKEKVNSISYKPYLCYN